MAHERLATARQNVLRVLRGELTPAADRLYFEEDVFYFDINVVEREDFDWLERELRSEAYTLERRLAIATQLYGERRGSVLRPLMAQYQERPSDSGPPEDPEQLA